MDISIKPCISLQELGPPRAEEPQNGFLIINVDLPPLCCSQFRPGPPSEKAQALTAYINNIAQRSNIIDLKSLCIEADKLVWTLYCDIVCLNYDGSVVDACLTSLVGSILSGESIQINFRFIKRVEFEDPKN